MSNRKNKYLLPIYGALLVIVGMLAGAKFQRKASEPFSKISNQVTNKLTEVLRLVQNDYVDTPNIKDISETAIQTLLQQLDPHSAYLNIDDVKAANEDLQGSFDGIGIEFNIRRDTIFVVTPISGGPSEELGIKAGDKIISIDGKKVAGVGFKNEDVFKSLRGKKGTKVELEILREGSNEPINFTIKRDKIPIYSIDAHYMITSEIGYIKVNRFSGTTIEEFQKSLKDLKAKGMKNLILDLRGNPGGYLNAAVELADEFIVGNELIVYTEGRSRSRRSYNASGKGGLEKGKIAVLINEGSASASEIVSGALQDNDRAIVIGRRSFGKGLVQEPFELKDGSIVRLTVARYYTPSGRSIQKPYSNGIDEYESDLEERYLNGELIYKDSIHLQDSSIFYTKNKRKVYGSGGIVPDIFVPIDTTTTTKFIQNVYAQGLITSFVNDYLDRNRSKIQSDYPNITYFAVNFSPDNIYNDFLKYLTNQKFNYKKAEAKNAKDFISQTLRALVARNLFRTEGYFYITNKDDETVQKAIESINGTIFDDLKIEY